MENNAIDPAFQPLDAEALDRLFREARSHSHWRPDPISPNEIQEIYEAKFGPTSANGNPARFIWAHNDAAKDQVASCVMDGNVEKVRTAAAVVIVGYDTEFHEHFGQLMPFAAEKYHGFFALSAHERRETAFRNSSLQGAYLMMAACALGFDCGPLSGFRAAEINELFFEGTSAQVNFLCCIGRGASEKLQVRNPRFEFDQINRIV